MTKKTTSEQTIHSLFPYATEDALEEAAENLGNLLLLLEAIGHEGEEGIPELIPKNLPSLN